MFSTMTTVASTIIPILMASPPKLVRLAESPDHHIKIKATSMQKGIAARVHGLRRSATDSTKYLKPRPNAKM